MKKSLLSFTLLLSISTFAQEAISSFYNLTGDSEDNYALVTSASGPDQATAGANVAWNFNDLVQVTTTATSVLPATAADIADYPGSTHTVKTVTQGGNTTYYYIAVNDIGGTAITGAETSAVTLNYSTNNGFLGNFPLTYGFTNTDDVAGTFDANGTAGTFTGTAVSTVDAYGTLTVNEGYANNTAVTRLKTVQNLTLIYNGIPVGTLTQTIYSYYNSTVLGSGPLFRSISTTINVPVLSINQTQNSLESYEATSMGTVGLTPVASLSIAPNPVKDMLHFAGNAEVSNVILTDAAGRIVLQSATANDISVSHLSAGIYYATVTAGSGFTTLKMVKD